jgi:hypothetical protein
MRALEAAVMIADLAGLMSAVPLKVDQIADISAGPIRADTVVKVFCASKSAILIQAQAPMRNVDSKGCSFRFDCCAQDAHRRLLQQYLPKADSCIAANSIIIR